MQKRATFDSASSKDRKWIRPKSCCSQPQHHNSLRIYSSSYSHQPLAKTEHVFAYQRAAVQIISQLFERTKQVEEKFSAGVNTQQQLEGDLFFRASLGNTAAEREISSS
jgi:hypothetical protein